MSREKARFHVRSMVKKDIPVVAELLKLCDLFRGEGDKLCGFFRDDGDTVENLKRKLARDRNLTVVAIVRGRVIGFMMASYDGWVATIWHYGILLEFHGEGIVHALEKAISKKILQRHRKLSLRAGVVPKENLLIHTLVLSQKQALLRLLTAKGFFQGPQVFVICRNMAEDS